MKIIILYCLISFSSLINVFAQGDSTCSLAPGTEVDLLPYLNNGYYLSVTAASGACRFRLVTTYLSTPEFMVTAGFKNLETHALAIIFDFFPFSRSYKEGFWIGLGTEFWANRITNSENLQQGKYSNIVGTVGCGYVIPVYRHLFINPWVAAHACFTGTRDILVGGKNYTPRAFMPEFSCKIGIYF